MNEQFEHPVYSRNVIEFVAVGREFCRWIETLETGNRKAFAATALKMLPLLYLKASILKKVEAEMDDFLETIVTEDEYERIRNCVKLTMGRFDDYLEVFTPDMRLSEMPLISAISENIADIYQDIKNFMHNYRTAVTDIMNDALAELINHFETYWGQCLVNVLRAIHQAYYYNDDFESEDKEKDDNFDTGKWLIAQRKREWENDV
ncbi:MAG: DUF5063 domain-containing protein [Cytophagaceae bacterium]|jgi:hypothetical protein|nr:DUF5063 domain-containing protein [Cytophagaceae bacterium]